jgi:hypothetical protein
VYGPLMLRRLSLLALLPAPVAIGAAATAAASRYGPLLVKYRGCGS